ncbi:conserved hypothetical protein [Nostocoides japonicum T1-X7]|uniref:Methyltransferase domain-containing protein n=1 Tax=Nostocoides japonicum T1-X7 TaxID=1194083 RepID=A0A077LWD5_9MICO|nr:DUF480 domain-containing protein [Tetrasphaera japonica]CCH77117.1 conserved hypothetical protein [Tetrasphaera japonica T1-X7]
MPDADPSTPVPLDPVDQRILGALMEKQRTVPATYPLTLNAVQAACNQQSSREPVVDYDSTLLTDALRSLTDRGLVRRVWAGAGQRTVKFHQLLDERLGLAHDECAVVTVLLLRGAQTAGELRTRCERLHPLPDKESVAEVLRRLADRDVPLARELPLRPREHDRRWIHLLGPVADDAGVEVPVPEEPATVLAAGPAERDRRVLEAYATVAGTYADRLGDELDAKPFDRWLLSRVVAAAGGDPVADVGCGPGHVTAYLAGLGADAHGFDLSPRMVEVARERHPYVPFEVADLRRLLRPRTAPGWGAVLALYSLIHLDPAELDEAVAALARVLRPGGLLLLAGHVPTGAGRPEVRHLDTWWDEPVDLDVVLHDPEAVRQAVARAGLANVEWYVRGPVAGEQTDRMSVLATRA